MKIFFRLIIPLTLCSLLIAGIYILKYSPQFRLQSDKILLQAASFGSYKKSESQFYNTEQKQNVISVFSKRDNDPVAKLETEGWNGNFRWDTSGTRIAAIRGTNDGYVLSILDVLNNQTQKFLLKNRPDYEGCIYLTAWNIEKNIIFVTSSMCEGPADELYIDMNDETKEFTKVPDADYSDHGEIVIDGNYRIVGIKGVNNDCTVTEMGGGTPSLYGVFEPLSGMKLGEFGELGRQTEIIGFTIDGTEVVYSTVSPEEMCEQRNSKKFYRKKLVGNLKASLIKESDFSFVNDNNSDY